MKEWKKPVVVELTADQLTKYIQLAARSGQCAGGDFR